MKNTNIKLFGKKINLKKVGWFGKIRGLMFKTKNTKPLLFDFKKECRAAIHSLFVFFEFFAIWLNKDKKVVDIKKIKPFTYLIKPKQKARYLLEIPNNKYYSKINKIIDGKIEKFKYRSAFKLTNKKEVKTNGKSCC